MASSALDSLRDIHLPPEPVWWQATEYWLAALAVVIVLVWAIWHFVRHQRLRAALNELALLTTAYRVNGDAVCLARGLSGLLRSYASARFPQAGVEGLAGDAWLDFLDAHGGKGAFRHGAGAALESLPYRPAGTATAVDVHALIAAVRAWLQENPQ